MLTTDDIKVILELVNRAELKGSEAEGVVLLKQKLKKILEPPVAPALPDPGTSESPAPKE